MNTIDGVRSRRQLLKAAAALAGGGLVYGCTPAVVRTASRSTPEALLPPVAQPAPAPIVAAKRVPPPGVSQELFDQAMAALDRHDGRVAKRDRIAIADFDEASSKPRFHFVNLEDGTSFSMLVAHGSGSDPSHTSFLQRFSNQPGSNATCRGAFLTSNYYYGKHDKSQRLIGLDPTNDNALPRAIVVHGAWYANDDMLVKHGKLGRSQGCFAVGEDKLARVFEFLGENRMIFAGKV